MYRIAWLTSLSSISMPGGNSVRDLNGVMPFNRQVCPLWLGADVAKIQYRVQRGGGHLGRHYDPKQSSWPDRLPCNECRTRTDRYGYGMTIANRFRTEIGACGIMCQIPTWKAHQFICMTVGGNRHTITGRCGNASGSLFQELQEYSCAVL